MEPSSLNQSSQAAPGGIPSFAPPGANPYNGAVAGPPMPSAAPGMAPQPPVDMHARFRQNAPPGGADMQPMQVPMGSQPGMGGYPTAAGAALGQNTAGQMAPNQPLINGAGMATAPLRAQAVAGAPAGASVSGAVTVAGAGRTPAGAPTPGVKPAATSNPNSTQNMLQIAEIRDGIVIMNDGSYRSVIMVKSINFDLMSQQEQEAVEYSFQSFLNSLYFPIQIFIRSQKVDLQPYIEKLDKIRTEHDNMLLAMLMEDYINYIDQLGQQTNIMDKKFYVVIPYFPHVDVQKALSTSKNFLTGLVGLFNSKDQHVVINEAELEKAKTELRNRVQSVLSGLLQSSIQGLPLDTQELIELYYDTYNPDTATRQQLKNFNDLNADIITKGQGATTQPHLQREMN